MTDRFGKVKYQTIRRDFNKLREAVRSQGTPDIQDAWDKCERWLEAIPSGDSVNILAETKGQG